MRAATAAIAPLAAAALALLLLLGDSAAAAAVAAAGTLPRATLPPAYGAEPWLYWGQPAAPAAAVVLSARGTARFTVLTPRLLRLEYSPDARFEDARTLAVWNRALPAVPPFSTQTNGDTTTIDTGAFGVLLTYVDDGLPFSAASLRVQRRTPAYWANASDTWTPADEAGADPGQLFGTFHTLDDGLNGFVGLNCSLLDPNNDSGGAADFWPCDFGLLSKGGFAVVDDSRSPVWDEAAGWLRTQDKATCTADGAARGQHCFAGAAQDTTDASLCWAAGCCAANAATSVSLNLWYSKSRDDHFSDNANCSACAGLDYVFKHEQGVFAGSAGAGLVALNLYWNANPSAGAGGDNVASTFAPTQAGYTFSRVMGYVFDPAKPQPPGTVPLKLYYSAAHLDHYTTAGAADEADALALGYSLVGLAGFITPAPTGPQPPAPPFQCFRPEGHRDLYLFAHGADYDAALGDYVAVAGPVPIPRRHWMGISWSKWNESEVQADSEAHVRLLKASGFPLDTVIYDMQWHRTPDWGGYDWDPVRYPDPAAALAFMHANGLATGTNFHDADGVRREANPERFAAFAAAVGADPTSAGVAFDIGNKTYADALQQVVLAPLIAQGLDFAWTDFQQGFPGVAEVRGLLPTAILNHYRFYNYSTAAGTRGSLHSRYAGRGDHRHTSHFGGDVDQTWDSLRFMIFFTATAANAPACWWGHEMMRQGGSPTDAEELFLRVNQFGAWSPTFTSWGNGGENNDWWLMREPYLSATRGSLLDRQRLLPLRYSLAAEAHRTGRCPIRSMYRDFPGEPAAYAADGQYMLGRDMVVAPAFAPVSPPLTGSVGVAVWLPPIDEGAWLDFNAPASPPFAAGSSIVYNASLFVVPAFVRAGAVLPMLPRDLANVSGISAQQYRALEFDVFPGGRGSGRAEVYEDDGLTTDHLLGLSATTTLAYAPAAPGCTLFSISTTGQQYAGMVTAGRLYSVFLLASAAPTSASLNGAALPQSQSDGAPGTWFRTAGGDTRVYLTPASTDDVLSLSVCV